MCLTSRPYLYIHSSSNLYRNRITHDVYLGSVELTCFDIHTILAGGVPAIQWFALSHSKHFSKGLIGGQLKVMFNPTRPLLKNSKTATMQVIVKSARDLANSDAFGTASPFARVYWDGNCVGQSLVIEHELSPIWNQKFALTESNEERPSHRCLYVEVWDQSTVNQKTFMGSVEISHSDVSRSLASNTGPVWYPLKRSRFLPPDYRYGKIQGRLELQFKPLIDGDEDAPVTEETKLPHGLQIPIPALPMTSHVKGLHLPDVGSLRSICDMFETAGDYADERYIELMIASFHPTLAQEAVFTVLLGNKQVYKSRFSSLGSWTESPIYLSFEILRHIGSNVRIYLTVIDSVGNETVVGVLQFSINSFLMLPPVTTSLLMTKLIPFMSDTSLQIRSSMRHPVWSKLMRSESAETASVLRSVQIISAQELSEVNDLPPSVSCQLFVGTVKVFETPPVLNSNAPIWSTPPVDISITLDPKADVSMRLVIEHELHQICIGVCPVPLDYLIHPPDKPIDVICIPLTEYKDLKFLVSGSARLRISFPQQKSEMSRSYNYRRNLGWGLSCNALSHNGTPNGIDCGTCFDYTANTAFESDSSVAIIPVGVKADSGVQVVCINRGEPYRNAAAISEHIDDSLRLCMHRLNFKTTLLDLRDANLIAFRNLIDSYICCSDYTLEGTHWLFAQAVMRCFPSAAVITASVTQNYSTIKYRYFAEEIQMREFEFESRKWEEEHGLIAANNKLYPIEECLVIETLSDLHKQPFVTFEGLSRVNFPRLVVPLQQGDPTAGFFMVERLSQYLGGKHEKFLDLEPTKLWLLETGNIFVRATMRKAEDQIQSKLIEYVMRSDSSVMGLLQEICASVLGFIRDCRLVEVWSLTDSDSLFSLAACHTTPRSVQGVTLIINRVEVSRPSIDKDSSNSTQRLLSIESGGLFQHHWLTRQMNRDWVCGRETVLTLQGEPKVNMKISDVDDDFSVLNEFYGTLELHSLAETNVFCTLYDMATSSPAYTARLSCSWLRQNEANETTLNLQDVKGFKLTIHGASGLISKRNNVSAFCEINWYNQLLCRSSVVQNSSEPVWDATFLVPFSNGPSVLVIDLYDMLFLKKGNFLGRVEIPFNELCFPSAGMRTVPLSRASDIPSRQQKFVGGNLTFWSSIVRYAPGEIPFEEIDEEGANKVLSVTVISASGLQKVDLIGSADPFVQG